MTLLAGNWARIEEMEMHYVGLDVSSARTAVCILDADGTVVRQCSVESVSGSISDVLAPYATEIEQPLCDIIEHLSREIAELDRQVAARAKPSEPCRRLMTVPGVGPLVALTYVAAVDDPTRFSKSRNVGAHFGLTPRRWQSGELDWSGGISRAGDAGVRCALYQAANALTHHSRGWGALKYWAVRLAGRRGLGKAKVALARKLAVVLHRMWISGDSYRFGAAA